MARAASPIIVNDGSDVDSCAPGAYTLRCAIDYANANPFTNIRFAPGLTAVVLQSALPTITGAGTWIDGTDSNGVYVGPRIDGLLAGSWTGNNGLTINASYVTVTNVQIVDIPAEADIAIIGGMDIVVAYDDLGILPGAAQCPSIASIVGVGVDSDLAGSAGDNNGTAYIYSNTISCHTGSGVEIVGSNFVYVGQDRTGNYLGNQIGTTVDGSGAAGNGYAGVRIAVASDSVTVRKNLIAHNGYAGVAFDGSNIDVVYNTVSANYMGIVIDSGASQMVVGNNIGTSVDGLQPWPNAHDGVLVVGGSGLYLSDNVVAYNGGAGIGIVGSTSHVLISINNFRNNGGLPIDLGEDGATPNGTHYPPGPDDWLAYPVVSASAGSLVEGFVCPNCAVDAYQAIGDPAAPGGGGTLVANTWANSSGQWSLDLPNGLTRSDVSFMAFDPSSHDSSELSPRPLYSIPLSSIGTQDGWILESAETSNKGGTMNSAAITFSLGDDKTKKQYRDILSFSTGASLPDTAEITGVTLRIKRSGIVGGGNPLIMFKGFMVDIKNGFFGTAALPELGDFQLAANKTYGPFTPGLVGGWYSINLTGAKAYINKLATNGGLTQIRLRFTLDDNNNTVANYLDLFSGNAVLASRPHLIITYAK